MILTDREIKISLNRGIIIIDPPPQEIAFSSTTVDLKLDPILTEYKKVQGGVETVIDPGHADFQGEKTIAALSNSIDISKGDGYSLQPNKLILGWTQETVNLRIDSRLAARVEGKSSLARLGLGVHVTAPIIHSGFKGRIRLEIINHGALPIRLRPGMRICQLVFEATLGTPDAGYSGQFLNQSQDMI